MNSYQEKIQAKIEYAKERSSKLKKSTERFFSKGFCETTGIPMGQPILVGHHSEQRHRKTIKRYENAMRKNIADAEKAQYYEEKAKRLEKNTVISSDDPEAVIKIKEKLLKLEKKLNRMKELNSKLRKFKTRSNALIEFKKESYEDKDKELLIKMVDNHFYALPPERIKAYYFNTSNINSEIRRLKDRVDFLEKQNSKVTKSYVYEGVEVVENVEENRLQLFFDGKPELEVRTKLKQNGFRWSPYNGCWQRMGVHDQSLWAMERVLKQEEK